MRYGVPYKGSKNSIAEWVYSHFPKADNFYDLFAGGCAITQVALMRQEYKNYICNDIDGDGIKLFLNAIYGKYKNENRWIDRATFFAEKDKDPYIKYCWSFGNNGRNYLYGEDLEPLKKAWHYAIFFNDFSLAEKLDLDLSPIKHLTDIRDRYLETKHITESVIDNEDITRYQTLERLQQLEEIANGFKGVETSFAIQAGREIRIIVKPNEVSDEKAIFMAKEIASKIEKEMEYPGQIKVNVIRETRAIEYAK